jgi:hypothetical protein
MVPDAPPRTRPSCLARCASILRAANSRIRRSGPDMAAALTPGIFHPSGVYTAGVARALSTGADGMASEVCERLKTFGPRDRIQTDRKRRALRHAVRLICEVLNISSILCLFSLCESAEGVDERPHENRLVGLSARCLRLLWMARTPLSVSFSLGCICCHGHGGRT